MPSPPSIHLQNSTSDLSSLPSSIQLYGETSTDRPPPDWVVAEQVGQERARGGEAVKVDGWWQSRWGRGEEGNWAGWASSVGEQEVVRQCRQG